MTLRLQLVIWIALVLTISLGLGSVPIYWHAVRKVENEMHAAILVGEHTVNNAAGALSETTNPPRWLSVMVAGFDGDRHLRVSLMAPNNVAAATSTPFVAHNGAPEWFHSVLATAPSLSPQVFQTRAKSRFAKVIVTPGLSLATPV